MNADRTMSAEAARARIRANGMTVTKEEYDLLMKDRNRPLTDEPMQRRHAVQEYAAPTIGRLSPFEAAIQQFEKEDR